MAGMVEQLVQSKLVLLGEMGSGKTSLVQRFVRGQYFENQVSQVAGREEPAGLAATPSGCLSSRGRPCAAAQGAWLTTLLACGVPCRSRRLEHPFSRKPFQRSMSSWRYGAELPLPLSGCWQGLVDCLAAVALDRFFRQSGRPQQPRAIACSRRYKLSSSLALAVC
jgi:GTPase SAR1 family protein